MTRFLDPDRDGHWVKVPDLAATNKTPENTDTPAWWVEERTVEGIPGEYVIAPCYCCAQPRAVQRVIRVTDMPRWRDIEKMPAPWVSRNLVWLMVGAVLAVMTHAIVFSDQLAVIVFSDLPVQRHPLSAKVFFGVIGLTFGLLAAVFVLLISVFQNESFTKRKRERRKIYFGTKGLKVDPDDVKDPGPGSAKCGGGVFHTLLPVGVMNSQQNAATV